MKFVVYIPLVVCVLYAVLAPRLAPHLPGRLATWLLSAGGFIIAGTVGWSLTMLAFPLVARIPALADAGSWSVPRIAEQHPVPLWLSAVALPIVLALLARTIAAAVTQARRLLAGRRLASHFPGQPGELVVVDDPYLQAAAVAGRGGRIVMSSGVLAELSTDERTVVLEHERSHLHHRHHLHHAAVALAAAGNPLLRRLPGALTLATERWADEDAARVTSRVGVARTLARLALQQDRFGAQPGLAIAATDTAERVDSLLGAEHPVRRWHEVFTFVVLLGLVACAVRAGRDTELIFECPMAALR